MPTGASSASTPRPRMPGGRVLSDDEIVALARMGLDVEAHYGGEPQDIGVGHRRRAPPTSCRLGPSPAWHGPWRPRPPPGVEVLLQGLAASSGQASGAVRLLAFPRRGRPAPDRRDPGRTDDEPGLGADHPPGRRRGHRRRGHDLPRRHRHPRAGRALRRRHPHRHQPPSATASWSPSTAARGAVVTAGAAPAPSRRVSVADRVARRWPPPPRPSPPGSTSTWRWPTTPRRSPPSPSTASACSGPSSCSPTPSAASIPES